MSYIDYLKASDRNAIKNEILQRYDTASKRTVSTQDILTEQNKLEFERNKRSVLEDKNWLDSKRIAESARINEVVQYNESVKAALLKECIMYLYTNSKDKADWEYNDAVAEAFVQNYINDTGATILLNRMKEKSAMLSEMSLFIEKACGKKSYKDDDYDDDDDDDYDEDDDDEDDEDDDKKCKKSSCKKKKYDEDDDDDYKKFKKYTIPTSAKDEFFDNLSNTADVDDVSQSVLMRVTNSMAEFINDSNAKKQRIEDTIGEIKSKVNADTTDEVKEALELSIKRRINDIENEGYTNLFGKLVQELCESAYKNDSLKTQFCIENKLDMEKVIQHVKTLYTVLEVLNTSKIENFTEDSIESIVESYIF